MRRQLESVLQLARELAPDCLPEFIGELEQIRVIAFARMAVPGMVMKDDHLIDVTELADRLHVSPDYIYRHKSKYQSFTKSQGKRLLFSSNGLNSYLKKSG